MIAIAAVDENFGIGYDNRLFARLPADMKRFRALTTGNTIIMGRNTYESLPSRPLPDRDTLVLTHHPELFPEVMCFDNIEALLRHAKTVDNDVYVCGGGNVYETLLPYCRKAMLTRVMGTFPVDAWFPNLDLHPSWQAVNETDSIETGGISIKFVDYVNNSVKALDF